MFQKKRVLSIILVVIMLFVMVPPVQIHAAGNQIVSCVIDPANTGKVTVTAELSSGLNTDDATLYLFAVPTYVDSIEDQSPVSALQYTGDGTYVFTPDLNPDTPSSLLYSKFYLGVKNDGRYTAITGGNYITNPEVIAPSSAPRIKADSKKGIHITLSIPTDIEEMGIEQGYFNIVLSDFISNTPTDYAYTYNGKTYYFTSVVGEYDNLISNMTKAGIAMTATLLNEYHPGYEYLLHPGISFREGTSYYAVNTSTQEGLEIVAAATHFLAERYNGKNSNYGQVDNWIVGNEVNDNLLYYYMGPQDVQTFVQEYQQTFRVMYTAIKSAFSNANVYLCLEHRWNTENSTGDYCGKDFIDLFNKYSKAQGDMDWGLSYHPYSFPANDPDILNDSQPSIDQNGNATFGVEVTDEPTTPLITMKNLHLLTDYFHNAELLDSKGNVRSIILGEQGYTSYSNLYDSNHAKQAANIALAYYMAEMNEDVDAFLLRGHCDEYEGSAYLQFGIRSIDDANLPADAKFAYEMYKYIDTPLSESYTEFAKAALNISDWSEVVRGWNPNVFKTMGTHTENDLFTVTGSSGGTVLVSGMHNQWEPGYNVFAITGNDYTGKPYPDGLAVANSFCCYMDYQSIEKRFDAPVSLSDYLTMDVNFKPMDASGAADRLELVVRLHSGDDMFDAAGIVAAGQDYTVCLDLRRWAGRNAVDTMEVLVREYGEKKSFAGTYTVYNVTTAANVAGLQALPSLARDLTDLSSAELSYQKSFNYTGSPVQPSVTVKLDGKLLTQHKDYDIVYNNNRNAGQAQLAIVGIGDYTGFVTAGFTIQNDYPTIYNGVDYSAVYSYGYYKENNPVVVAENGDDPQVLLEHFVTVGMHYALQATGDFNPMAYAKMNGDVRAIFCDDWAAYYIHYLEHGIAEGRPISGIQPEDMEKPKYPYDGHIPVIDPAVPSTCTTTGLTEGSHCDICGTILQEQKITAALGHLYHDPYDTSCDVCGDLREVDVNRPTMSMYRMYDPNSGEHFYTGSMEERQNLVDAGWAYEGIGFTFPLNTGDPVHRLYDPVTGEHLYTMDVEEMNTLLDKGWNYEGIAFNSGYETEVPQYRLHNPNETRGAYHFTASIEERDFLISVGWEYQGIGFYSCWK